MTTEQTFFLQVLSDHLHKRTTNPPATIDWTALSTYASNHEVAGILYKQCQSFMPATASLAQGFSSNLYYYSNRVKLFSVIADKLEEEGITFYTVKGLDVAALYPVPALRTMGDCDIVVHPVDKDHVHEIMLSLGYRNERHDGNEWTYFKNNLEFEIHDHLLYDEVVNNQLHKDFTEIAWEYTKGAGCRKQLDWNFHFIFLLLHLKKHLMNQGVGFRQFMDLAVVVKQVDLNWEWVQHQLNALELTEFFNICSALIYRWFGILTPNTTIDEDFYVYATDYVFANGVFGFDNEVNKENRTLNKITTKFGPRWLARISAAISGIFPSYKNMRYVQYYSFVDGKPWLLPVAWIYRYYRAIRYHMVDNGKSIISKVLVSNEKLDTRERELRKWGL